MMIELSKTFNVSPETLYNAWLDSEQHSNMTGAKAECNAEVGGTFSAWDGYISGYNKSLIKNVEIIQAWRTTEFSDSDKDSELKITFLPVEKGCKLTLTHSNIPRGQSDYEKGWIEHYFTPMEEYFENITKANNG